VHYLGWFQIHPIRHWAACGALTALKTKIGVMTTQFLYLVSEGHRGLLKVAVNTKRQALKAPVHSVKKSLKFNNSRSAQLMSQTVHHS
jgi:hypothetical protein